MMYRAAVPSGVALVHLAAIVTADSLMCSPLSLGFAGAQVSLHLAVHRMFGLLGMAAAQSSPFLTGIDVAESRFDLFHGGQTALQVVGQLLDETRFPFGHANGLVQVA